MMRLKFECFLLLGSRINSASERNGKLETNFYRKSNEHPMVNSSLKLKKKLKKLPH